MKSKLMFAVLLSLSTVGHSAVIKSAESKANLTEAKGSLIEKAITQQKQADKQKFESNNDLKVLTSINLAPTQNFFALQNQRFSRFVQALFPQGNS
ncbi:MULTISPECIES: hypothetical protein [Acinetobacter]|uniref:hypothetical protein n=1 Tax=Acinetobacter TaxID=469 RepID=UPI001436C612|nr:MULTISPECIES: hypothetical protein [Acinetobacter]MCA4814575.1 hypothetical protein [Acinetobacter towneri]MCO8059697.1 hypothetical protein [Acinetobacter towneri]MCO8065422.1 hypothetical protein [Acinetobacter towneri]QIV93399.1 hypothetical protein GVU25_11720 [Acinetobacter towneri]